MRQPGLQLKLTLDALDVELHCSYIVYMVKLVITWDPRKASANERKHGVSFDEASSTFYDDSALLIADPQHSDSEDRFILLGYSSRLKMLAVCHCHHEDEETIRIISARKATKTEKAQYADRYKS